MKKYYITAAIGVAMTVAGAIFGNWGKDFMFGAMFASGCCIATITTLGQWLSSNAIEKMDKLQRDELEDRE